MQKVGTVGETWGVADMELRWQYDMGNKTNQVISIKIFFLFLPLFKRCMWAWWRVMGAMSMGIHTHGGYTWAHDYGCIDIWGLIQLRYKFKCMGATCQDNTYPN